MKNILKLVAVLTGICAVSGFMMAFVYNITEAPIAAAEAKDEQDAVNSVMPPNASLVSLVVTQEQQELTFFVGRDEAGRITGVAATGKSGNGYGGDIKVMVGITATGTVSAIKVLKPLKETPGLGANIEKDAWTKQFRNKPIDCKWSVTKDDKSNPHGIDAITAATISSRAVVEAVDQAIQQYKRFEPMIQASTQPGDAE